MYCEKCGVSVAGERQRCPLCQGTLTKTGSTSEEIFPKILTVYRQHSLLLKMALFVSVAVAVAAGAANLLLPETGAWSLFVLLGVGCLWGGVALALRRRRHILKNILCQVFAVCGAAILWDAVTGWHGWSLDYVLPMVCLAAMAAMGILLRVLHVPVKDGVVYVMVNLALGLVPMVLFLAGCLRVRFPSVLCAAASILFLAGLLIFAGGAVGAELRRRLHL